MDHGDTAQLAAVCGAVGAALVLLPVRRAALLAGLALLAIAEAGLGWALTADDLDRLARPAGAALVAVGVAVAIGMAAVFVRRPEWTPVALVAVAPFRLPVTLGTQDAFLLVPLYGVLAGAVLAFAVRAVRGPLPRIPIMLAGPAAALFALAGVSLLWSMDLHEGSIQLGFFYFPFAALTAVLARSPVASWLTRVLFVVAVGLASVFALIGLWQWQTKRLFFAEDLEVANTYTSFFRVTSLFKDPSLYGRALIVAIIVVLVALWLDRLSWRIAVPSIAFLFAGLFVSYSQSSMVTLGVVAFGLSFAIGDRRARIALTATALVIGLAGALVLAREVRGDSARRVTADRTHLVDVTTAVIANHPLVGVGVGAQPRASAVEVGGSSARNASHTTPLTVAAELGIVGLALYLAFLGGVAWALLALVRVDRALGLGLAGVFSVLIVHSLMYSGFFEDPLTWGVVGLTAAALNRHGVVVEPVAASLRRTWGGLVARGAGVTRGRVALAVSALLLVAIGIGVAVAINARQPPGDHLDTNLKNVTVLGPKLPGKIRPVKEPKSPRKLTAATPGRECWLNFGGDPHRSLARPDFHLGRPGKPLWARAMGSYMEYPPSYCDGVLYANTDSGKTVALDAETGKPLWAVRGSGPKPSSPAIAGPLLIVSSHDGTVTALVRRNGRRVWQLRAGSRIESSPIVSDDTVYVGSTDGRLFALDAQTGKIRWAYDTGGRINSSPSIVAYRVCITTYAGGIFCLRKKDGKRLWKHYIRRDSLRYESFYASPSSDGTRIFTVARSGKMVALRVSDGKLLWTAKVGGLGYSTPAVAEGRVFAGGFDGRLRAFNASSGRLLWRATVPGRILAPALVVGDLVFFSTLERKTYAARVSDGKLVWKFNIGKYAPGIATERQYYFSLNGLMVAFRPAKAIAATRVARAGDATAVSAGAPRPRPASPR